MEIVREMYAAFNEGDAATVLGHMDARVEWTEPDGSPYAGTFVGPDAVAENVFARLATELEGYEVLPERFVDGGDTVVVLGTNRGTARATGTPFDIPFAHVCEFEGGKLTRFVDYADTHVWRRALAA